VYHKFSGNAIQIVKSGKKPQISPACPRRLIFAERFVIV
jgi:hypothetical protein